MCTLPQRMGGEVQQLLARRLKQVRGDTNACRHTQTHAYGAMEVPKDSGYSLKTDINLLLLISIIEMLADELCKWMS